MPGAPSFDPPLYKKIKTTTYQLSAAMSQFICITVALNKVTTLSQRTRDDSLFQSLQKKTMVLHPAGTSIISD